MGWYSALLLFERFIRSCQLLIQVDNGLEKLCETHRFADLQFDASFIAKGIFGLGGHLLLVTE